MAAIPTILRGDDSGAITINIASGRSYAGATLVIAYQGVTRKFTNLVAGGTVSFAFTHDETAAMQTKTAPMLMRLIGQYGAEETVENADARIKVTDCLAEVNAGGSFVVQPGGSVTDPTKVPITDVGDMAARYTLADLQAKVNQIVRVLAQRSLLCAALAFCGMAAFGDVSVATARLDALYNDSLVVTNVAGGGGAEVDPTIAMTNGTIYIHGDTITPVTSLSGYATEAWVEGKGYVTESVTNGLAAKADTYTRAATDAAIWGAVSNRTEYSVFPKFVPMTGFYGNVYEYAIVACALHPAAIATMGWNQYIKFDENFSPQTLPEYLETLINHESVRFSNEVLAVSTGVSTNDLAAIRAIADLPFDPTTGTTTIGGILAALAAAVLALNRKKASSLSADGVANPVTVENGTADVSPLFATGNTALVSTIDSRLPYPLNTDGTILDRHRNIANSGTITIPSGFTDLIIRYTGTISSIGFAESGITDYGDGEPSGSGDYLIAVTRTKASEAYVRIIKMEAR